MAETTYTYSITDDTANGRVNLVDLREEILASTIIAAPQRIDVTGGTQIGNDVIVGGSMDIVMKAAITQSLLDTVVATHTGDASDATSLVTVTFDGIDPNPGFILTNATGSLPYARVVSGGVGINIVDGGAGGTLYIDSILSGSGGITIATGSLGELVVSSSIPTATPITLTAGQSNSDGISSSFARSDHVHRVSDPTYMFVGDDNVTTTSSVYTPIPSMSISPGQGTYITTFSAYGLVTDNSQMGRVGLYVDDVFQTGTLRVIGGASLGNNRRSIFHSQGKLVITGSESINARYSVTGESSLTISDRSLLLQKVDG